ncbi:MAG: type II/IV secretion system protein [Chloroflexi bacterium]|nr:type II/IV secretion system protein [Chloroflexota bacterium]
MASRNQMMMQSRIIGIDEQIGRMLVEGAFLTREQLEHAKEKMRREGKRLREVLAEEQVVSMETFTTLVSVHLRVPIVDLQQVRVEEGAVKLVPENVARENNIMPLQVEGESLRVAMEEPQDVETISRLSAITGKRIKPVLPLRGSISELISSHYKLTPRIAEELGEVVKEEVAERPVGPRISTEAVSRAPVVRALDMIIAQGVRDRASDIHVEPLDDKVRVRYRIDGVLHEVASLPKGVHGALLSRVKVLGGMDIAERRRPQDGQFSMEVDGRGVDFRVASVETAEGEIVTLRILDKSVSLLSLSDLGFQPRARQVYEGLLKSPFGMVLVSGPTGSGKTTTLYASMGGLDAGGRNIMTIEDPVEYRFKGINQIQVNPQAGISFASGLRASMRLDPDIILVGEIRDKETAQVAVQAALTGHLVLTTIHANDAAGALVRLVDLGVEPFLATSAVVGTIAQRLLRRVCSYCRTMSPVSPEEAAAYQQEMVEVRRDFYVGRGCNMCSRTGYTGRVGVYEVLAMSDSIRALVARGAMAQEIKEEAVKEGMISMRRDGMLKSRDGITTPGEVIRNVFTVF